MGVSFDNKTSAEIVKYLIDQVMAVAAKDALIGIHRGLGNDEIVELLRAENEPLAHKAADTANYIIHAMNQREAQEPRLLTVDDFKDNSDVDICGYLPCWVEPNPHGDAATEKPGWGLVSVGQIGGVYHRYWTGKPTQEQMEATPWQ